MINLAPWYYRNLLGENELLELPDNYQVQLLDGTKVFESNIKLKEKYRPSWLSKSALYKDCDGSGTSEYQNIAVYKAISESLERMAFYFAIDSQEKEFSFDVNPTTTGMASFPHFFKKYARENARKEAVERWAIHEFNRRKIPVVKTFSQIENLNHYDLIVPFDDLKVSLLEYYTTDGFVYGFACGSNIVQSFNRALIELDRNKRVLKKLISANENVCDFSAVDKTFLFFSSQEGNDHFSELIKNSSKTVVSNNPKILCDKELKGIWSDYTVVWRFLLQDSYFDNANDSTFFMF